MKSTVRIIVTSSVIAIVAGCQNGAAMLQNGGLPMRVPPPATGSYKVQGQYSQIGTEVGTSLASATAKPAVPFSPVASQLTTTPISEVQPATFQATSQPPTASNQWQSVAPLP